MSVFKNIWFYVALIICGILCWNYFSGKARVNQYLSYIQQQHDTISQYKDKKNRVHSVKSVTLIPKGLYKHIADSVVANLRKHTKAKNLLQHSELALQTANNDSAPVRDTIVIYKQDEYAGRVFDFNDGALEMRSLLYADKADVNYTFNVHLSHTTKWKRKGLFKPKVLVVDVFSNTPNTTITNIQSIVIKQPPKKWYETRVAAIGLGAIIGFAAKR